MKYRFIGILGNVVGHFATHGEARTFTTSIPGMSGIIVDRLLTPLKDAGEPDDASPYGSEAILAAFASA